MIAGNVIYTSVIFIINSSAPGRFQITFRQVIFKLTLVNGGWGISFEIALRWMPLDLTDDKSTLVQVMAWCRQATSHYLSQCWPRSMLSNGVTRPQWVNKRDIVWCLISVMFNLSTPGAVFMCQWIGSVLVQIMACRLLGTKPLFTPMPGYWQLDPKEQTSVRF